VLFLRPRVLAGHLWRFDMDSELLVDLSSGSLVSVTDTELFAGANTLAIETPPGQWEIAQAVFQHDCDSARHLPKTIPRLHDFLIGPSSG